MNDKKIAFIICVNHMQYYEECMRYIQELYVPEGYETDMLCIQEADSMAQGYNAGMQATDAKYKVYLHQDAFILNRNFLKDALEIFQENDRIGMLGVLGAVELPADANCYLSWRVGNIMDYDGRSIGDTGFLKQLESGKLIGVEALNGVLMMTQIDVPWREDLLDGWDFYDISQSIEMRKRGYQVVIPYQEQPWLYHDNGAPKLEKYDFYRHRMIEEYPECFSGTVDEMLWEEKKRKIEETEDLRKRMTRAMSLHTYEQLQSLAEKLTFDWPLDTEIREIMNLMEIYHLEETSTEKIHSEWFRLQKWEDIYAYYRQIRWILLRLGFGRQDERIEELKQLVETGKVSRDAICKIANISLTDTAKVFRYFTYKNQEEPLVSVCIPVYNGAEFVRETIDSVLNQTYKNLEVLIVDDCSTDKSREIIRSYEDPRVIPIFPEKNGNVCQASNLAFTRSKGKYIALIGHDDIWKPDKVEKQVAFLEEHETVGVCFTWTDFIDENGNIVNSGYDDLYHRMNADNKSRNLWMRSLIGRKDNSFCAPSACIRKSVLKCTGYYRYGLLQLQDYDLWLRILLESEIYVLQEKLTLYRRFTEEGKNISRTDQGGINRMLHELQWILASFVNHLSDEQFLETFGDDRKKKDSRTHKEVLCQKTFFLWNLGCCFAEDNFMNLLEDEESREILEKEYGFTLNDFYALNKEPMHFDYS